MSSALEEINKYGRHPASVGASVNYQEDMRAATT
jgi:hypothetical protein